MVISRLASAPRCPRCNKLLDACTSIQGDEAPEPGDYSICTMCYMLLRFTAEMGLEAVNTALLPSDEAEAISRAIDKVRRIKTMFPADYIDSAKKLRRAAIRYHHDHPGLTVLISFPEFFDRPGVMLVGGLNAMIEWCKDEESKDFLRWLDEQTDHQCTIQQFKAVVLPMLTRRPVLGGGDA